jgi:hypothetical protein
MTRTTRSLPLAAAVLALATPALAHPGHEAPLFHTHAADIGLLAVALLLIGAGFGLKRLLAR